MTDAEINQSCSLSAFEKLPGEIRNKIYNLVLRHNDCPGKDSVISISTAPRLDPEPVLSDDPACFALLFVNKFIYREAASFLYAENTFFFMKPPINIELEDPMQPLGPPSCYIQEFFKSIGPAVKYIRKIQLECFMIDLNMMTHEPWLRIFPAELSWEHLIQYLDRGLRLTSFDLKMRMCSFEDEYMKGQIPEFPFYHLNETLLDYKSLFSNHFQTRNFRYSTDLAPNYGWTSDMSWEEMKTVGSELRQIERRGVPGWDPDVLERRPYFEMYCHLS